MSFMDLERESQHLGFQAANQGLGRFLGKGIYQAGMSRKRRVSQVQDPEGHFSQREDRACATEHVHVYPHRASCSLSTA